MADVWRFVMAVGNHWIVLVGGTTIIILLGVAERLIRKEISPRLYASLLVGLFFCATFLAWKEEHDKVSSTKNFDIGIQRVSIGEWAESAQGDLGPATSVTVMIGVVNRGPASILRYWSISVKPPTRESEIPLSVLPVPSESRVNIFRDTPTKAPLMVLSGTEAIYIKTLQRIDSGAWTSGFLVGLTRAITRQQLSTDGTEVIVRCQDAFNETYEVREPLRAQSLRN
jgi:hypothetical protein